MKIDISGLRDGVHCLSLIEKMQDDFVVPYIIQDKIKVDIKINKSSHSVLLNIAVEGALKLECDRCLDYFPFVFNTDFDLLYEYNYKGEEIRDIKKVEEFNSFDIKPDTKYIDITEPLRDYILLSIPMRKVPEETDEICSYCKKNVKEIISAKNDNSINPVWDKLKNLNKNK